MQMRLREFFILLLIGLLPLTATSAPSQQIAMGNDDAVTLSVQKDDATGTRVNVNVSDISSSQINDNGETLTRFETFSEALTGLEGYPELPMVSRTVLVPPTSPVRLVVNNIEYEVENEYSPFITPHMNEYQEVALNSGAPSDEYLTCNGFWPPEPVIISEPAILRGNRLVTITMFPIQVNPRTGETRYNNQFDVELAYDEGNVINPVQHPERDRSSRFVDMTLRNLTVNYNREPVRDNIMSGSYLYIVPTVDGLDEIIAPLIEWRIRMGHRVVVEHVNNNANSGAVSAIIDEAYQEWDDPVEFVTIVGDASGGAYNVGATSQYGDYDYTRVDGNDPLPDIALGRLSANTRAEMQRLVNKVVSYETNPYMEDTDWYNQGGVVAGHVGNGLGTVLVAKYARNVMLKHGWREVRGWFHNVDGEISGNQPFLTETFDWGVSAFLYRAYQYMNRLPLNVLTALPNDDGRWPMVVAISCNTGDFVSTTGYSETWLRSPGGAIAVVSTATPMTHPQYNNIMAGGTFRGIYQLEMHNPGWGVVNGKYELWQAYDGFDEDYTGFMDWNNLMGDPGIYLWTDIPQLIIVEHDEQICLGQTRFTVHVQDEAEGTPLEGAQVCLSKDEEIHQVEYTDAEGNVIFDIAADALSEGDLLVTVTKHNVKPYLGESEVVASQAYLGAEGFAISDGDNGDGDGIANPGELFDASIALTSFGEESPDGQITVTAVSRSAWGTVVSDPVVLNQAPAPGESSEVLVRIQVNPSAPDGLMIPIDLVAESGEESWESSIEIEIFAPHLVVTDWEFDENVLERGSLRWMDLEVTNIGRKPMDAFIGTVSSSSDVVMVRQGQADYNGIAEGESGVINGDQFRIQAHVYAIPGMYVDLQFTAVTQADFHDTTNFVIQVDGPGENEPFGPDSYGYVCFDDSDEGWEMAPVYDWVEIDPDEDNNHFDGTNTELRDTAENNDASTVVDLPFTFQYYGEDFDQITICTNGWAAFGEQRDFMSFRNRHIAQALGPDAHLAIFWDNLITNNGKILYHYDEDGGRFIIEWSNVNRLHNQSNVGEPETFEIILYDVRLHSTYTGDGMIVYQYKEVNQGSIPAHADTPYATVGIGNLDDSDGLECTYWNIYTPGAKQLEDEMAIKFTTAVEFITGVLSGTVIDEATGQPVPNAEITTSRGFWGVADSLGNYLIDDILIGDGYSVSSSAQGYNPTTHDNNGEGYTIVEAETTRVDFSLLHPEFNIDLSEFRFQMNAEDTIGAQITLSNDGNGPLEFNSRFTYVLNEDDNEVPGRDSIWDTMLQWTVSDSVDDSKIRGVEFIQDHWVVSGGANGSPDENFFYIFDRWGQYVERFPQPIQNSRYGLRDLFFDGTNLWAPYLDENRLLKLDPETFEIRGSYTMPGRLRSPANVAIDPDGNIWICAVTNDIYKCTIEGDTALVEIASFDMQEPRTDESLRVNGISWFRDDPDHYFLYFTTNNAPIEGEDPDGTVPDISLYKMNPENGDIVFLTHLSGFDPNDAGRGGMCITPRWNNMVWAIGLVTDNAIGDKISVIELAPNSSWIDYSPRIATLAAGEIQPIDIMINTADLDTGSYGVVIEFTHNAYDGLTAVPVDLIITALTTDEEIVMPVEYSLNQNYPNPFNPSTSISYSLKNSGFTTLTVYDMAGRQITELIHQNQSPGHYRIAFDGQNLPAGMYFYRIRSGEFTAVRKMLLLK